MGLYYSALEFFLLYISLQIVNTPAPPAIIPFIAREFFIGDFENLHFLESKSRATPKANHAPAVLMPSCIGLTGFCIVLLYFCAQKFTFGVM